MTKAASPRARSWGRTDPWQSHPFRRASVRYSNTPEPVTPYQKAAQVWDERLGSARVQASNWRLAALAIHRPVSSVLGLSVLSIIDRADLASFPTSSKSIASARSEPSDRRSKPYKPSDAQIAHFLARFIENVRSLSIDPVVVRTNWLHAYDFVTDRGAQDVQRLRARRPIHSRKDRLQDDRPLKSTSVVRASGDSFEIRWKENTYENGTIARTERFTGLVTHHPQAAHGLPRRCARTPSAFTSIPSTGRATSLETTQMTRYSPPQARV